MKLPELKRTAFKIGLAGALGGTLLGALLVYWDLKVLGMTLLVIGWLAVFIAILIQRSQEHLGITVPELT